MSLSSEQPLNSLPSSEKLSNHALTQLIWHDGHEPNRQPVPLVAPGSKCVSANCPDSARRIVRLIDLPGMSPQASLWPHTSHTWVHQGCLEAARSTLPTNDGNPGGNIPSNADQSSKAITETANEPDGIIPPV